MPKKKKPTKQIRVRSKRLDQLDESKLALAFWMLAQQVIAEEGDGQPSPPPPKDGAQ